MTSKTAFGLGLCIVIGTAASTAVGQSQPRALPSPPPGFRVLDNPAIAAMKAAGVSDGIVAEKPNAPWSKCATDPKIQLQYGWTLQPGGDKLVEMLAQAPEDPASETNMIRSEPAGKRRHKGGVLIWRKTVSPVIGTIGDCGEDVVITHDGRWTGFVSGKLVGVSVVRLYGSKEIGQAWIDEYIDKVVAAVNGSK